MALRIAFDCDGCLADLDAALEALCVQLFGDAPEPRPDVATEAVDRAGGVEGDASDADPMAECVKAEPARFRRLTRRQQHDLWDAVRRTTNFWETLGETEPGIVRRLSETARAAGWEVIFITQRPPSDGDLTQIQTQRWLAAHGYEMPSVYVIRGSRGRVADALSLDVVVDDRPENCLDVKLESRARAILVWGADVAALPPNVTKLGIEPVAGIGACLDRLTAAPAAKPGVLSRLRKLVGA